MKTCGYCGRENGDPMTFCTECGSALAEEPQTKPKPPVRLDRLFHELNAWSATTIFLAYFVAEVLCVMLMAVIVLIKLHQQGIYSPDNFDAALRRTMPQMMLLIPISTGAATILVAKALIPKSLKDTSSTGAAWVLGRWSMVVRAFVIGLLLGATIFAMNKALRVHVDPRDIGPLGRMVLTPGMPQILCTLIVVLLAPLTEEILFRGVLYGGYRKSLGSFWAFALTTLLFGSLHLPQVAHYLTYFVAILLVSLVALWARLSSSAIGPAIAVHVGYNSMLFLPALFVQLIRH